MKKILSLISVFFLLTSCIGGNTKKVEDIEEGTSKKTILDSLEENDGISHEISEAKAKALANAKAKVERDNTKNNEEALKNTEEEEIQGAGRFIFSYPYKCELLGGKQYYYPEKDMEYSENVYSSFGIYIVRRDGLIYTWIETRGKIPNISYSKDTGVYSKKEIDENFGDGMNNLVDKMTQKAKDTCTKWDLDESIFELPKGIDLIEAITYEK